MAKSDNLPIYNSAFSLLKNLHERVPKFSKLYKYGLGEKVLVCGMDIVLLIVEANNQKSNYTRISSIEKIIKKTRREHKTRQDKTRHDTLRYGTIRNDVMG